MNIAYEFSKQRYSYSVLDEDSTASFFLSNTKGDFFHQGINGPTTKFHGYTYCNGKTLEMFKVIDDCFLDTHAVKTLITRGYEVTKEYEPQIMHSYSYPVSEDDKKDEEFGERGELFYDTNGLVREKVNDEHKAIPKQTLYLGPTGGIVCDIENYNGNFFVDLDIRKHDDFNEWGRIYDVYRRDSTLYVHYTKKDGEENQYELFFGIHLPKDDYTILSEWVRKTYSYSTLRNSLDSWYVYRLISIPVDISQRVFMASGKTQKEVDDQLFLLHHHFEELREFDKQMQNELLEEPNFAKPLSHDVYVAYQASVVAMYKFLSKNMEGLITEGSFAGYPWFHQIWTRDELVSLRGYLELGDYSHVLSRLFEYVEEISQETGELPRLHKKDALTSPDGVFWLAKRIEDIIFYLDRNQLLSSNLSISSIQYCYRELSKSFSNIIKTNWDNEKELLYTKQGDSWMDTVGGGYTLDIQVQLLGHVSTLSVLAGMLNKKEDEQHYLELENLLKNKIRTTFLDKNILYNDDTHTLISANIFLVYYFYPQLFESNQWEQIMDKALQEMKMSWGGIASISKNSSQFHEVYTGEDNESYHRGDSWFWINNIAAIVLNDLNEKKYRSTITSILFSSTKDILQLGTFGYGSEVSSASKQEARGCLAQLWSTSTYIEMVYHIFNKENLN